MAEWSKACGLGPHLFGVASSNLVRYNIFFADLLLILYLDEFLRGESPWVQEYKGSTLKDALHGVDTLSRAIFESTMVY